MGSASPTPTVTGCAQSVNDSGADAIMISLVANPARIAPAASWATNGRPIFVARTNRLVARILFANQTMARSITQRLISMLCLVAIGLGQTVFSSMGVRCTDASGETRIEYACIKTTVGLCPASCIEPSAQFGDACHESDSSVPTPCEDELLGLHVSIAKLIPVRDSLAPVFAAVVVAILWDHWSLADDHPTRLRRCERDRDRPANSLAHLRSVILIV